MSSSNYTYDEEALTSTQQPDMRTTWHHLQGLVRRSNDVLDPIMHWLQDFTETHRTLYNAIESENPSDAPISVLEQAKSNLNRAASTMESLLMAFADRFRSSVATFGGSLDSVGRVLWGRSGGDVNEPWNSPFAIDPRLVWPSELVQDGGEGGTQALQEGYEDWLHEHGEYTVEE